MTYFSSLESVVDEINEGFYAQYSHIAVELKNDEQITKMVYRAGGIFCFIEVQHVSKRIDN